MGAKQSWQVILPDKPDVQTMKLFAHPTKKIRVIPVSNQRWYQGGEEEGDEGVQIVR